MWSLPRPSASLNAAAPAASAASPVATPSATTPSASLPTQVALAPPSPTRISTNAPALLASGDADVLERARTLARRPDVTALMALRDDVALRARERGIAGSASVKGELDELDRRLNEARTLQLKLDAEEFRKADSKPRR
jgi:hypothetical protein